MLPNQMYHGDNMELIKEVENESVDLTTLSSPYDEMRLGFKTDWNPLELAKELYRITKTGGVCALELDDSGRGGKMSGTKHRVVLKFLKAGWNLKQEITVQMCRPPYSDPYRYTRNCHSLFIFVKGKNQKTMNFLKDKENSTAGDPIYAKTGDQWGITTNGGKKDGKFVEDYGKRGDLWKYKGSEYGPLAEAHIRNRCVQGDAEREHRIPVMSLALARDIVASYTNRGDLVFDPFGGSGTTGIAAMLAGCNWLAFELDADHVRIAEDRLHWWKTLATEKDKFDFGRPVPLTSGQDTNTDALAEWNRYCSQLSSRVMQVVDGHGFGLYVYGRAGLSKTHTVTTTLEECGLTEDVEVIPKNHVLTPRGMFDILEKNRNKTLVLDDVGWLFGKPNVLTLLLAALGPQKNGKRMVTYTTAREELSFEFTGSIIAISNLELKHGVPSDIREAVQSRMVSLNFNPSDASVRAKILDLAGNGLKGIAPETCIEIAHTMFEICDEFGERVNIRLFTQGAIQDYQHWDLRKPAEHWVDLLRSRIEEELIKKGTDPADIQGRSERIAAERQIAIEIEREGGSLDERLRMWNERTGKGRNAFYDRIREAKKLGLL